jgi:CO/xanthine dehydrogenase Mo-binding subunit
VGKFGTGQAIRRSEDLRFITGDGQYTDDISLENQAYLYLLRSPYAHGRISTLEVAETRNAAGVIAVYTADDLTAAGIKDVVGVVINPLILEGQIMGGVAQGLGQACAEHAIYDPDSGQLLTATFMDYPMPRADWIPDIDFRYQEIESPRNPLGVKGAGEAGTVGAAPAYINAVINALSARDIDHIDMPATPLRIWQLLHDESVSQ